MDTMPPRVAHLSSAPFSGGAARAAFRLHEGLLREGVSSLWLDAHGAAFGEAVRKLPPPPTTRAGQLTRLLQHPLASWRKRQVAQTLTSQFADASTPWSNPYGWASPASFGGLPLPHVWNLHWVSWMLDWKDLLPWLARQAPLVWTLHDLNPLRGVWHYEPLPAERSPVRDRLEEEAFACKRACLQRLPKDRLVFVGPSRWIADCCRRSPLTAGFRVEHIPYGLDTGVFQPRPRTALLDLFGIPHNKLTIGFVADSVKDPRKGLAVLAAALQNLPGREKLHLLTVGRNPQPIDGLAQTHIGSLQSEVLLSHFYSACDLFACPSLQDNLPNTVLEALACGAPVLAFNVGGLPDMVHPGLSGFLADPVGDPEALGATLAAALAHPDRLRALRPACRDLALREYPLALQARRYRDLYASLPGATSPRA